MKKYKKTIARVLIVSSLCGQIFFALSIPSIAQAPGVTKKSKKRRLSKKEKILRLKGKISFLKKRADVQKKAKLQALGKNKTYKFKIARAKTKRGRHKLIKKKERLQRSYRHHSLRHNFIMHKINILRKKLVRLGVKNKAVKKIIVGKASWYGRGFRTASGERFRPGALTAAMRGFRGRKVKVVNLSNKKSVIVRVNDHGPARWTGRIIDLSRGSFSKIASTRQGVISRVKLYVY